MQSQVQLDIVRLDESFLDPGAPIYIETDEVIGRTSMRVTCVQDQIYGDCLFDRTT